MNDLAERTPTQHHKSLITEDGAVVQADYEVTYWEEDNKWSLINLVTPNMTDLLKHPDVKKSILLDELAHQKLVKPTKKVSQLRISFWKEYAKIVDSGVAKKMNMVNVYQGIACKEYFFDLMKNAGQFSWILRPPTTYITQCEELLEKSISRMREILDFPLWETKTFKNTKGEVHNKKVPNTKVAELIIKIHEKIEQRVMGAIPQRVKSEQILKHIEEKRVLIIDQTAKPDVQVNRSVEEIQAEIDELKDSCGGKTMDNLGDSGNE